MAKQSSSRTSLATRLNGLQTESGTPDHLAEYNALRYDYGKVNAKHRRAVQDAAVDIRRKQKRVMEDLLAIGRRLLEVKDFLPFGEFGAWIDEEFELSERMVQGMMNAARVYLDEAKARRVALLSERAIYMLSASSTPEEARAEVEQLITDTGKTLTSSEVERIIKAHKAGLAAPAPRMIEMEATTLMVATSIAPPPEPAPTVTDAQYPIVEDPPTDDELAAMAEVESELAQEDEERAARDEARAAKFAVALPESVQLQLPRSLAHKLRDAVLHRLLKSFLTSEEQDQLVIALSRALDRS